MMMPRPTATSAAATAITKITITWPAMLASAVGVAPKGSLLGMYLAKARKGEVNRVQHHLDAHEDHDRIAPNDDADSTP